MSVCSTDEVLSMLELCTRVYLANLAFMKIQETIRIELKNDQELPKRNPK